MARTIAVVALVLAPAQGPADPGSGAVVAPDSPDAQPDRRAESCFRCEVAVSGPEYFDLSDVRLLDGPFRHAQEIDRQYLLALEPDRLLAGFRTEAGLTPRAEKYPNWESSGLDGHTLGHYLTGLAQMWAATADAELKRRLDYTVSELGECQRAQGDGYVGAVPGGRQLWTRIESGAFDAQGFSLEGAWVPWYNVHKTFAGLRDAWLVAGNEEAREILIGLADWCGHLLAGLTDDQVQSMLRAEHGGMNEVLADVFAITGEERYLALAQRFSHRALLEPLLRHEDELTGLHANTQIPKVVGYARIAELGGDPAWDDAARFFWETVVDRRSVAFGGNSVREHFNAPDDFESMLESREGPETCNTYNMLRLTEALFRREGDARYADYYERALFNHILSTQHPDHGGFVYFTPIRPRHYRVYSQPSQCFWCCVGSGLESHGKYGRFVYAHDADGGLWVNLFLASELDWPERGLRLRQETRFPDEAVTRLTLSLKQPRTFALRIRHPVWLDAEGLTIRVNDEAAATTSAPGTYATLTREWRDGDRIEVELPMRTRLQRLPDGSDYAAIEHGPVVLAARTGGDGLDGLIAGDGRMAHRASGAYLPLDEAPMLVGDVAGMPEHVRRLPGDWLRFEARELIRPAHLRDLELVPFFRIHDARYMLYWRIVSPGDYDDVVAALEAREKQRLELDRRTVDLVIPGEQQPEVEHGFQAGASSTGRQLGRAWRDAQDWFAYELQAAAEAPLDLRITTWGLERDAAFAVVVNGREVGTLDLIGDGGERFVEASIPLPEAVVEAAAEGSLRVEFRARPGSRVAPVYEVRLVRRTGSP